MCAKDFLQEKFVVLLEGNIFQHSLSPFVQKFQRQVTGARVLLKEVYDPTRCFVLEIDRKNNKFLYY